MVKSIFMVFLLLIFFSCTEDFVASNPLDPENPEYNSPVVSIISGPSQNEIITDTSITLVWTGNEEDMLFQYKIDDGLFSGWTYDNSVFINYLDEGPHQFLLQAKYTTGDTSEMKNIDFTVDALPENSLRLFPWKTTLYNSNSFTIDVIADEVENLASAFVEIEFDNNLLNINSVSIEDTIGNCISPIFIWNENEANTIGRLELNFAFIGDNCQPINGAPTMKLTTIEFEPQTFASNSHSIIKTTFNSQYRNFNNYEIEIENGVFNGVIIFE